ncbi:MAG: phosphatidylglycerol lysyltransferase domain-containing protein [Thermodesulfobacteriota bacterium]|nr:phosphatidylglycerol lysyltransferase domain-containing protein [Thermodesulfobacteriota bacterium]
MYPKDIPDFPELRPLELKDRDILQPRLWELQPDISDCCFTNLFIWQDFYNIQISQFKGNICLFSSANTTPEKEFFFPPLGQGHILETLDACFDFMLSRNIQPIIRRGPEKFVRAHLGNQSRYVLREDLDIADYIYRTEDMITLRGRRYHGQRNFIKRFKQSYPDYSTEFLHDEENIPECLQFNNEWLENKLQALSQQLDIHSDPPPDMVVFLRAESETARKILMNFESLDLTGLAVRIDRKIRAFTVGQKLNTRTALVHIEKADHSYLGLSQFLSQAFCEQAWADCEYINRMEDLGIEGLRKAKLALGPHHLAKKYTILPGDSA